ncbi:TPA: TetR/AcrR family transcriptional regulator [Escherichia coli]|uniref:TetR/AcrR family transcriptional regulator n=1 Tax=Klebsiella michiganensis TaxID=1134687 RepID=A0AB35PPP0_9ENTR|nr:TetR/AcrR family transcriptional regulator [Klebsiella michiganensis]MCU3183639.1 TetR/AcrR family transcriptional regulator [Enterobacter hormaechei subsp. steigerwaltii]HCQ0440106.1 TetR/AcrR family transcriptional regulator [Escherichia coli]MBD0918119.1 TetR/AcrR family transcriptional regulator [Klebsiella michiganensis]MBD0957882.1 TetR/AcrR family transcriptional regulator [Klebsiella michiganensis]MBG2585366.1 TetR/AcrR family transcriptional regulator [Klebsiella michiganensis]
MKSIFEEKNLLDAVQERTGGRSARVREAVLQAARQILMERGTEALTHRNIAQLANVNASTVYRRWPDRARLIADVYKNTADSIVQLPDSGSLKEDLLHFLQMISAMLTSSEGRKLVLGGISATSSNDESVKSAIRTLWEQRFQQAELLFEQAIARGEEGYKGQRQIILETLIAPVWFRILVTQEPVDKEYLIENINRVLAQ